VFWQVPQRRPFRFPGLRPPARFATTRPWAAAELRDRRTPASRRTSSSRDFGCVPALCREDRPGEATRLWSAVIVFHIVPRLRPIFFRLLIFFRLPLRPPTLIGHTNGRDRGLVWATSPPEIRESKVRSLENSRLQRCALKLRAIERRALKLRVIQRRTLKLRAAKKRALKLRVIERRAFQISPGEVDFRQNCEIEDRAFLDRVPGRERRSHAIPPSWDRRCGGPHIC